MLDGATPSDGRVRLGRPVGNEEVLCQRKRIWLWCGVSSRRRAKATWTHCIRYWLKTSWTAACFPARTRIARLQEVGGRGSRRLLRAPLHRRRPGSNRRQGGEPPHYKASPRPGRLCGHSADRRGVRGDGHRHPPNSGGQDRRGVERGERNPGIDPTTPGARDTRARACGARAAGGAPHPASLSPKGSAYIERVGDLTPLSARARGGWRLL